MINSVWIEDAQTLNVSFYLFLNLIFFFFFWLKESKKNDTQEPLPDLGGKGDLIFCFWFCFEAECQIVLTGLKDIQGWLWTSDDLACTSGWLWVYATMPSFICGGDWTQDFMLGKQCANWATHPQPIVMLQTARDLTILIFKCLEV